MTQSDSSVPLPLGYKQILDFNLRKNKKAMLVLNIVGVILFMAAAALFSSYLRLVRPLGDGEFSSSIGSLMEMVQFVALLLLDVSLLIVLHEGVHGLCFWLITGKRPVFSIGAGYAAAASPRSLISKKPYMVVALSPLVVLTAIGLILVPLVSTGLLFYLGLFIVLNISGAVGDLWVAGSLLFRSEPLLVQDFGDRVVVYQYDKLTIS